MRNIVRFFVAATIASSISWTASAAVPTACMSDDDREKAIASCTTVIDSPRSSKDDLVAALKQRAMHRSSYGEKDEALADIERALAFKPNDASLYSLRADTRGEYDTDAAITDVSKAIELAPKVSTYRAQRAKLYMGQNDYRAEEDFSEAIRLDPKNPDRYMERLAYYSERHEFDKAIADATAQISLGQTQRLMVRAQLQMYMQRFSDAMSDLDKLVTSTEFTSKSSGVDRAIAYGMRGFCLMSANQIDKAINDYSKAITGFDNKTLRQLRGNAFVQMKQYELAIQDYSYALKDSADDVATLYLRATAYDLNGQPKQALADRTDAAFYSAGLKKPKKN